MNYFNLRDEEICYNSSIVKQYLREADDILEELCKNTNRLVSYVENLEENAHDKEQTCVDEDYKDFEAILSYQGLNGFIRSLDETLSEVETAMQTYERAVRLNQQRKCEEEKRKSARASSITFR